MHNFNDFSIIIQGPLNKISLNNVENYQRFGQVIISHWNGCETGLLENIKDVVIVNTDWEKVYTNCYNYQNIYRQIISTLAGLERIKTKFTIKVRSDESYSDLSYFIDVLRKNETKLITNNVFFRQDNLYKFHPSDHVLGGQTEILRNMFTYAKQFCKSIKPINNSVLHGHIIGLNGIGFISAEMILMITYLLSRNIKIDIKQSKELMKEFIELVSVSKMGNFIASATCFNAAYTSEEQFRYDINGQMSIINMEEL